MCHWTPPNAILRFTRRAVHELHEITVEEDSHLLTKKTKNVTAVSEKSRRYHCVPPSSWRPALWVGTMYGEKWQNELAYDPGHYNIEEYYLRIGHEPSDV